MTNQPGATPSLRAQLGFGPDGSDPAGNAAWTWVEAAFNIDAGNNDEFMASLLPEAAGDVRLRLPLHRRPTAATGSMPTSTGSDGYSPPRPAPDGQRRAATPPRPPRRPVCTSSAASPAGDRAGLGRGAGDATLHGYEVRRSATPGGPYTTIASTDGHRVHRHRGRPRARRTTTSCARSTRRSTAPALVRRGRAQRPSCAR